MDPDKELAFNEAKIIKDCKFAEMTGAEVIEAKTFLLKECKSHPILKKGPFGIKIKKYVTLDHINEFFSDPKGMSASQEDYYHTIVKVAKTICKVGAQVCPYINKLPD